jgi:hypothetical protein
MPYVKGGNCETPNPVTYKGRDNFCSEYGTEDLKGTIWRCPECHTLWKVFQCKKSTDTDTFTKAVYSWFAYRPARWWTRLHYLGR